VITGPTPNAKQLRNRLDGIYANSMQQLASIGSFPPPAGVRVLSALVEYACQSQHIGLVLLARQAIAEMPSDWLIQHLPEAIVATNCLDDEWQYRRMLELLRDSAPQLLQEYVARGLSSDDSEIVEAARDFSAMKNE
jgi:hypothetical protein